MLGRLYETQDCAAARALEEIGERWSLLILRDAVFGGVTRFSDFQRGLGIATNILTKRLEGFVVSGIMEKRASLVGGEQAEYVLTDKGRDLKPVIMAMSAWGETWVRPGRMRYCHAACDHHGAVTLALRCSTCGTDVASAEVDVRPRS